MITRLIAECSDYDFKSQLEEKKPRSWLKSVSAFANGIGGSIFFGISNDKLIVGIDKPQETCDKISELINSRINPIPRYKINLFYENNKTIIELKIYPGPSTPYYYNSDGSREVYIRSGNQSMKAPTHILDELILKGQNKTYDSIATKYKKFDYSFTYFEATLFEKTSIKMTESDYISFCLMDLNGYLTNAGVLLADQNIYRHNRVFCTRWNGLTKTSLMDALDDAEYSGSIVRLLELAMTFITNNSKKKWYKTDTERKELPDYSAIAVREALVNALIHRQYTNIGSEISIDMFDDRLIITSPGSNASGIPINKDIIERIPSIRRNPILADIFAKMRLMDRRGSGFDKIKNETNNLFNDDKSHIEFYSTDSFFMVVIYNSNFLHNKSTKKSTEKRINIKVLEESILKLIKDRPSISIVEISIQLKISIKIVRNCINKLTQNKIISHIGPKNGGYWKEIN